MEILPSARKHGLTDDDITHALEHAIERHDLDDGFVMMIGPTRSGRLIEVGVATEQGFVAHAMNARAKFLRRER